jgi:hypothetical protein
MALVDNLRDHFGVESEHFGRGLNTLDMALTLGPVHSDSHRVAPPAFVHFNLPPSKVEETIAV